MKQYFFKDRKVFADEVGGVLVWPKTRVPFLNQQQYSAHPRQKEIDALLKRAEEGDDTALQTLWGDEEIMQMALRSEDAI